MYLSQSFFEVYLRSDEIVSLKGGPCGLRWDKSIKEEFMSENEINNEETGWNEAVVMICSQCGKEAEVLKSELKAICKDRLGKDVRVINTGCLNICPENKIAVTVASKKDGEVFHSYSVPKDVAAEKLFDELF